MTKPCYRVRKPITVGDHALAPGELVPQAVLWEGHIRDRLVHTGFIVSVDAPVSELEKALQGADPELIEHYGYGIITKPSEPKEELPAEDTLIGEPARYPRVLLETMTWGDLRTVARENGMKQYSKREEIIDTLSQD